MKKQKYIAPGSWFTLEYPANWHEFEDMEDCFLFYNPDKWTGNFRISAYRGTNKEYARKCMMDEKAHVKGAEWVKIGEWDCVYSMEKFHEKGVSYVSHIWVTGKDNLSVECSFTTMDGESAQEEAENKPAPTIRYGAGLYFACPFIYRPASARS